MAELDRGALKLLTLVVLGVVAVILFGLLFYNIVYLDLIGLIGSLVVLAIIGFSMFSVWKEKAQWMLFAAIGLAVLVLVFLASVVFHLVQGHLLVVVWNLLRAAMMVLCVFLVLYNRKRVIEEGYTGMNDV
eukprot:CAMPEP_0177650036 /NCGR_PEP_ID=MMETSP0447-20121125/11715_1 /TAXON_ID=0 /ORGANISM="Stygamoeba regulata, Strain BSH-02190019" /LENGTH=130 /DNA_ID=CAMNT_0019152853 /DNA_START=43 /DNA_END=435 /DNA_ORIENTATION=+